MKFRLADIVASQPSASGNCFGTAGSEVGGVRGKLELSPSAAMGLCFYYPFFFAVAGAFLLRFERLAFFLTTFLCVVFFAGA